MKRISLAYKLVSFFSASVFLIISIVVVYSYVESSAILEYQTKHDLAAIAEGTEGQILIFFEKIKMQSTSWSSDVFMRQQTEELVKTNNQDFAKALRSHLLKNKMSLDPLVVVADILNTDMKTIASSDERRVGVEEHEHAEGKSKEELMALKYGQALISQVTIEQASEIVGGIHPEYPVFHSLTPIKSSDNETTIGFLLLHFSADNMNKIVGGSFQVELGALSGQEFILNQKTAEMFLVNKDGFIITPSRFIEGAVLNKRIDNPATQACFKDKKEYSGSYVGYLGKEVQVASMCLVNYDIILLAEIGTDEIFAPLIEERNDTIILTILLWIASVIGIFLFSRIFLKNILEINKVANKIKGGDFSVRARVKSRDEVGDLANVFNLMLDDIEHSRAEIDEFNKKLQESSRELEKLNFSLEGKIKERTRELEEIKATLELRVHEKTVELQERLSELEKFKRLTTGRELRMIELKEEIENLKRKAGGGD